MPFVWRSHAKIPTTRAGLGVRLTLPCGWNNAGDAANGCEQQQAHPGETVQGEGPLAIDAADEDAPARSKNLGNLLIAKKAEALFSTEDGTFGRLEVELLLTALGFEVRAVPCRRPPLTLPPRAALAFLAIV